MEHHLLHVDTLAKPRVVTEIAARDGPHDPVRAHQARRRPAGEELRRDGIDAGALHGGKAQNARNRAIAAFKDGQTPVLVATDVAARGIHVDDVSLVVHVDPPADPKDYLHRAGRTARAGESGTVVTMVTPARAPRRGPADPASRACAPPPPTSAPGDAALAGITGARTPSGCRSPSRRSRQPARVAGRRPAAGARPAGGAGARAPLAAGRARRPRRAA